MCMGCMANADFALTSGILGVASAKVGLRRILPGWLPQRRKVTEQETRDFIASLTPTPAPSPQPAPTRHDQLV